MAVTEKFHSWGATVRTCTEENTSAVASISTAIGNEGSVICAGAIGEGNAGPAIIHALRGGAVHGDGGVFRPGVHRKGQKRLFAFELPGLAPLEHKGGIATGGERREIDA